LVLVLTLLVLVLALPVLTTSLVISVLGTMEDHNGWLAGVAFNGSVKTKFMTQ